MESTLVSTAAAIAAIHLATADRDEAGAALGLATRLIRMAQAVEIDANLRLEELAGDDPTLNPEHVNATATGRSLAAATRSVKRATDASAVPVLRSLVARGELAPSTSTPSPPHSGRCPRRSAPACSTSKKRSDGSPWR